MLHFIHFNTFVSLAYGRGSGPGHLDVLVNGGRVTSHVSKVSTDKYSASFIPHFIGRHRVDVKFNGEKVAGSPWFVEVQDPDKPLLAPQLVTGKIDLSNGHHHNNSSSNNNSNGFKEYETTALRSDDFNSINSRFEERSYNILAMSNNNSSSNSNILGRKTPVKTPPAPPPKPTNNSSNSSYNNNKPALLVSSLRDETKSKFRMEPSKEFGEFSALLAPSLLQKKQDDTQQHHSTSFTSKKEEEYTTTTTTSNNSYNNNSSSMFSTTITKPVKSRSETPEKSFLLSEVTRTASPFQLGNNNNNSNNINNNNNRDYSPKSSPSLFRRFADADAVNKDQSSAADTNTNTNNNIYYNNNFTLTSTKREKSKSPSRTSISPARNSKESLTEEELSMRKVSSKTLKSESTLRKSTISSRNKQKELSVPPVLLPATAPGSTSPKLSSYRGTADKCKFEGDTVRHFNAGKLATFEVKAPGYKKEDVEVNIISPEKRPHIPSKVVDEGSARFRIEFTTVEVGSYLIDVNVKGLTVPESPLIAKAYDAGLIKVTDITDGIVGDLSTFRGTKNTEVFGSNGSVGDGRFVRYSRKSILWDFLKRNLHLGIAKMSVISENLISLNPVLPKTSVVSIENLDSFSGH